MDNERLIQAKKDVETMKQQIAQILAEKNDRTLSVAAKEVGPVPKLQIRQRRWLKGHLAKVNALHWADDKHHLLSASQDGKLIVWDALTMNKEQAIPLKSTWVMTCAYAPSQAFAASGGLDNVCSVFNLRQTPTPNKPYKELNQHTGYISGCRFLNDRQILTSSGDGLCLLWDLEKGEKQMEFADHRGDVLSLALSPTDKNTFITGGVDAVAKLWDLRTGKCTQSFYGNESDVNSVTYFPNGNSIVTGSDDRSCRLFDIRAARDLATYQADDIMCGVTSTALSASGRLLFAGYETAHCVVWDVLKGEKLLVLTHNPQEPRISTLGVTSDGMALATASWDFTLKVWA